MKTRGIVAAGSAQAAEAATALLEAGGNAADALVAGAFATSAGDAAISSLAGGACLIYRSARTGRVEAGDFFVDAPGRSGLRVRDAGGHLPRTALEGRGIPALDFERVELDFSSGEATQAFWLGRAAAAVPSVLPGLAAFHAREGRLPWSEVLSPAIDCLRRGFALSDYQAHCLAIVEPMLTCSSTGRALFAPRGQPLVAGEHWRNVALADTLQELARAGFERGYRELEELFLGEFGEPSGGLLTRADLESYRPRLVAPLETTYRSARVHCMPRPAEGGDRILRCLGLLERDGSARAGDSLSSTYHRFTAALRVLDERSPGEDPGVSAARYHALLAGANVPEARVDPKPPAPGNTTHLSVIDAEGNAAGLTLSHGEGCGHWVGDTGLHMNNILGEEGLFPAGLLRFRAGERLSTLMSPTLLEDGDGALTVLGSGGSNRIPSVLAGVIVALLEDGLPPEDAVARARLHFEEGRLSVEEFALEGGAATIARARELAREVDLFEAPSLFFGGVHLARRSADGELLAVGDERRGGTVRRVD